ncbi:MAG: hypothetical protein DRN71_00425 [Candidatus Nanohalarchaeota archaeon]|nr:MAG: hypothetical protein DRN71_00425 [Candidatus Nanohaloarchaeota archaeon]
MGEEQLFNMLKEKPMSVSELARRLDVRREYLGGYLEALRDSGRLERIMVGRSYVYRPIYGGVDEPVYGRRLVAIPAEEEE